MTPSQLQTLKTAILADPALAAQPMTSNGALAIAQALNTPSSPAFAVWRTDTDVSALLDAVDFAKYTPTAGVTGAESEPQLSRKIGWLLELQTKQINLQVLTQGRQTLNTSRPNVRGGLRDAVIQLPSGALDGNGKPALTTAGGNNAATLLAICTRNATEAERILALASSGSDTTGVTTARVMGFEGAVTSDDVQQARELP